MPRWFNRLVGGCVLRFWSWRHRFDIAEFKRKRTERAK